MSKISKAIQVFHEIDRGVPKKADKDEIHPLAKLFVTIVFLITTISFPKYNILGMISMVVYIVIYNIWYEISWVKTFKRTWPVLLITCMVGMANPIVERHVVIYVGAFAVTNGMISMLTLMIKGVFCVMASYSLIMTTPINGICYGLNCLHVPKMITTSIMLMYRYIIVLLKDAERMWQSYRLRAPKQRGLNIKVWGSFVGQLLIRSIDRGQCVYESMLLRGYNGEFYIRNKKFNKFLSVVYAFGWCAVFLILRYIPIFTLVGNFMCKFESII